MPPTSNRVAITGLGVISAIGAGKEAFWDSLKAGRSGIKRVSKFDPTPYPTQFAAQLNGFDFSPFIDPKWSRRMDLTSQMAVAAAKMAVKDAALDLDQEDRERIGVVVGTAMAGHAFILEQHDVYKEKGPMRINPFTALTVFPDAPASFISIELRLHGPSFSLATACSSALDAVGYAFNAIRKKELDVILMGGAEATVFPQAFSAFCMLRAMSQRNDDPERASRPFDKERDGFVLGEGAGMLVLEDLEHARKRGAHIYAEIVGFGMTCDAYHMTAPEPSGRQAARAINIALKDAGIKPADIDYINAHGTSTPLNDKTETFIIKQVFGRHAYHVPVSATKSMIGHLIGAAGAVELIATTLALEHQVIPPTINYEIPDPECDLDYVPNVARKATIDFALKNSFGFGGKNSALVVKKYEA
ncbi:MAG: beta-ketoacyl-[acyl-carrier-protein] synthase II [Omnitrophica WOR_2 bacterium RIFCSPHIGHO2_02_FULL_67_20]|nr:MAG: beta-ketoacyl-[acyl-carrier-protein] synthase II [Omnitrophica WOR_2 bacterium RIFCSPHIGHO2_02_FULL_67_20]